MVHPGVYAVGHTAPSVHATYMAAVLACGHPAALCGLAAAFLLRLVAGRPPAPEVLTTRERRIAGVITHRTRRLERRDTTTWRGIRTTNARRTLVDLAAILSPADLARAFHEASVRYGTTPDQVEEVLDRRPNAPGAATLRAVLRGDTPVLLSELERRFRELLQTAGLPLPITNRPAGAHYVDCRWPDRRLTVELDSYRFHSSRHAWEQDRRRERNARARGDDFRRLTWGDVVERPAETLAELRAALG